MVEENCFVCKRIGMIKNATNPYFVAELDTGYVVIGDDQLFRGYTLFLCKWHKTELHFLDPEFKNKFLMEMSKVAEAVYKAFHPDKLNYEMLGNGDAHMHWHLFPRRQSDKNKGPVWWTYNETASLEPVKLGLEELQKMKIKLFIELEKITPIVRKGQF